MRGRAETSESSMIEIEGSPAPAATEERRDVMQAMGRGARCRCPACGEGKLYSKYLKVVHTCDVCGTDLHHQRADDAPPYFTMMIVGHVVVGGLLALEVAYHPPTWVHLAIWLPLLVIMSLVLLPIVKGALVGLQWALRMHGFGGDEPRPVQQP
jgi:uncharacterized protein (DUF983 family)